MQIGRLLIESQTSPTPTFLRELYSPAQGSTNPDVELGVPSRYMAAPADSIYYSIVFVHGLNPFNTPNFAEKTWTHENGTFWPKDILHNNVPNCRILLFGYNSNVAFDVSLQGIKDHATTLLDRFVRNRKATEVASREQFPRGRVY